MTIYGANAVAEGAGWSFLRQDIVRILICASNALKRECSACFVYGCNYFQVARGSELIVIILFVSLIV